MFLRVMSDLHNEFTPHEIPVSRCDVDSVLILAGDIDIGVRAADYALQHADRFLAVLLVLGNHEYYKGQSLVRLPAKVRERIAASGRDNVHLLNASEVEIGGVRFAGATLWTDFRSLGDDPRLAALEAEQKLTDYKRNVMRTGTARAPYARQVKPRDTAQLHSAHRAYLFERCAAARAEGVPIVVVTHHLPAVEVVAEHYRGDALQPAYASDLGDLIRERGPDLWVFGHQHESVDMTLGCTRLIANPRGYVIAGQPEEFNEDFDPLLSVELG